LAALTCWIKSVVLPGLSTPLQIVPATLRGVVWPRRTFGRAIVPVGVLVNVGVLLIVGLFVRWRYRRGTCHRRGIVIVGVLVRSACW